MLSSFSSNVVFAKARAMFGKHFTTKEYSDLLSCQSVSEVALYLKSRTNYSDVLSGLNENDVHRGYLELLLKRKLFSELASLCRFELSIGAHFSEYIVSSFEVEQIMHSLMFLVSGVASEYLFSLPLFFNKHTKIDLVALSKMKNYDEFLKAIEKSKYFALLKPFRPKDTEQLDLSDIENVLYSDLYTALFENIEKYSHGAARKELFDMLTSYIDMKNFVRIIRLKKYYKASTKIIQKTLLPCGSMPPSLLRALVDASNEKEVFDIMKKTHLGKNLGDFSCVYLDELTQRVRYSKSFKNIRFSRSAAVVLLSYAFLLDVEITNIINIIEGVRYNVPSSEIKKMLVF